VEVQQKFVDSVPSKMTGSESCPLTDALNRTLSQDITAPEDMPPYHRAIVEGFLVNTSDTENASESSPVSFTITGEIKPGDSSCPAIKSAQALRVSTGSIVSDGPLSVVRMWEAQIDGETFTTSRPFPPRFFIEDQGCDYKKDTTIATTGTVITPKEIGTIASFGINTIEVAKAPVVSIFSSGDEVIPYTETPKPGAIRDSNSIMLSAAVSNAGATPTFAGIMSDDFDQFVAAAKKALETSDMLLISGGTAIGGRDFISDLIQEIGELIVDGVPMRSGRPLIMGIADNKPIICVAGHPPEALRGFKLFGVAAINKMLGIDAELPQDAQ